MSLTHEAKILLRIALKVALKRGDTKMAQEIRNTLNPTKTSLMERRTKISIGGMASMFALAIGVQFLPDGLSQATNENKNSTPAPQPTNAPLLSASLSNPPIKLLPAPRLIPVYVLPEVIVIQAGGTTFRCIDPVHLNELSKLFGAFRITNVVIYSPAP